MTHSVYWIRHADHTDLMTQGYVGVSGRFDRRMWEHFKLNGNRYLKFAIKKYGWDSLVKSQLLISTEDYCLNMERKLRPEDKIGWNIVAGGGKPPVNRWNLGTKGVVKAWNKGLKMSDETRAKVSAAAKEQWTRLGMRELLSNAKKGKPSPLKGTKHKPESIEKMRLIKLGKKSGMKGKKHSEETLKNIKAKFAANPWICPHCGKIGLNKGTGTRWHFDNCKEKVLCQ